jgi:RNA polymerase sigma factor (TIGR02999 family)
MLRAMSDVTRILSQIDAGDPRAAEELLPLVYEELRKLAAVRLAAEKPGQTLQATALVHEAYVRLVGGRESGVGSRESERWDSRGHFFAAAAEAMRRILVDEARSKGSAKRGGDRKRIDFEKVDVAETPVGEELVAFSEALETLAKDDPDAAQLVKLRYFAGLSVEDAGAAMGLPRSTAYDHWTFGRAWLRRQLRGERS